MSQRSIFPTLGRSPTKTRTGTAAKGMPKSVDKSKILAQFKSPVSKPSSGSRPRFKAAPQSRCHLATFSNTAGPLSEFVLASSAKLQISEKPADTDIEPAPKEPEKWNERVAIHDGKFYIALDSASSRDFCYKYGPNVYIYC